MSELRVGDNNMGNRFPVHLRHRQIMSAFSQNNFISVTDIAEKLGVSTMTIRRDLIILERSGKLLRTHGGAIAAKDGEISISDDDNIFDRRYNRQTPAKDAIAKAAAKLVSSGMSVGLDSGSTVLATAHWLAKRDDLMIFTTNLRAANAQENSKNRVYIVGGEVNTPELSIVGLGAINTIKSHYLDFVFIGVSGLDTNGVYDFSPEETEVKKAYIENANKVVVLCDSCKFGTRALARIIGLNDIDILVSDAPPPREISMAIEKAGIKLIIADSDVSS